MYIIRIKQGCYLVKECFLFWSYSLLFKVSSPTTDVNCVERTHEFRRSGEKPQREKLYLSVGSEGSINPFWTLYSLSLWGFNPLLSVNVLLFLSVFLYHLSLSFRLRACYRVFVLWYFVLTRLCILKNSHTLTAQFLLFE